MSDRVTAACRAVLLMGSAALIAKLFVAGEMVKYMAPALDPLTILAGIVLGAMGVMEARRVLGSGRARTSDRESDASSSADHDAEHGLDVDDDLASGLEHALMYLVVLLPLALGLLVTPRALGSSALGGERVTSLLLTFAPGSRVAASRAALSAVLDDVGPLLGYLRQVGDAAVGQRARVIGMVARSDALGANEFALLRYSIAHCVADARPVALLVVAPRAPEAPADHWVEVEGDVASREREGDRLVTIVARRITLVEEPANPYLFAAY